MPAFWSGGPIAQTAPQSLHRQGWREGHPNPQQSKLLPEYEDFREVLFPPCASV